MDELTEITMEEINFVFKPFCGNKKFISDILEKKLKFCGDVHGGLRALCTVKWDKTQGENETDVVEALLKIFKSRFPDYNEENISAAKCILDHICELEKCLCYERQKQICDMKYKNRFEKSLSRINKYVEPTDDWTDEDYEHIKAVTDALRIASDMQNLFLSNHEFYGNKEQLCNEAKERFKSCHSAFRGIFALSGLKWNNNNGENAEDVISDLIKCFKEHFPNCQRYDIQLAENCLRENIGGEKA